jgi:lysophospholipase L1-like esterase
MRFRRVYSPSEQIDALRLRNLYPDPPDDALADQYLTSLVDLADLLRARGIDFVLIKPPVTERWYRRLPDEARWDVRLQDLAARHRTPLYDFSQSVQDESLYFDADHLNRAGVMRFFEEHLVPLLRAALAVD